MSFKFIIDSDKLNTLEDVWVASNKEEIMVCGKELR